MKGKILILLYIIAISIIPMLATAQLAESDHPYANNFAYTWPAITEPGASQMRLHFTKIDISGGENSADNLQILDKDGKLLTSYRGYYGFLKEDFWTDWYTGDTLKVRLETNNQNTAWGFQIDQKETRTSIASSNSMPESYHPYANNFAYTWPAITEPGASQMRLHFTKIDISGGENSADNLQILDKDGKLLTSYRDYYGFLKEDFWTDWYTGGTLKVRLETNNQNTAWGFQIDQKETRTSIAPSSSMPESYHPYANNFAYTWPAITEPGASQMRLHFTKIDISGGENSADNLQILDKDGKLLTSYRGYYGFLKEDFWTDWYTGDTLKVRLETNNQNTAWGFQIDQKDIRAGTPAPTQILTPPSTKTPTYTTTPPPISTPKFTPTQTLTPPSTNTPTYTTAPPPISTPRITSTQSLTPPPEYSFDTEPTNTPTYTTVPLPISTPGFTPTQTHTPPPYLLDTTHITETSEPFDWKSVLVILVVVGLIGIIFNSKNANWQNSIWLYFVVAVIAGIVIAIFNKIWELS